ncbi:MAG: PQQ-dependent sugar dehydrogenase [Chitinophagaceae bacterium]|nr:PQQ-dependent sugar dehydrogenase [Chitinophagaceae bacterium]
MRNLLISFKSIAAVCIALLIGALYACNAPSGNSADDKAGSVDTALIAKGKISFEKNCVTCHNFRQDGIGPQLSGITGKVSAKWLHAFIKDPAEMIASGDQYAVQLHQKYKAMMPPFTAMEDGEIDAIIAFLATEKSTAVSAGSDSAVIKDPFPEKIPLSGIEIGLQSFVQVPASAPAAPKARITKLTFQPGTNDLFVVDLRGILYKIVNNKPEVYMDMAKLKPHFMREPGLGVGFGSFAFHPEFQKNGLLYTIHTETAGAAIADFRYHDSIKIASQGVLTEWKVTDPKANAFSGTGRELLRVNMVSDIHGVQEATFNPYAKPHDPDYGLLYVGIGDGGSVEHGFPMFPHNTRNIWGTVIRIDPRGNNSKNGQYGIPADNPFVHAADTATLREIYSYGFRNPHRITWTRDRKMLVFNIGQHDIESIYDVKPGNDNGWPLREGNFLINPYSDINKIYALPADDSADHITYPVAAYDHDEGKAISGGYEYTGSIPLLKGKIIFGDIAKGRIFYIEGKSIKQGALASIQELSLTVNGKPQTLAKACGNERVEVRLGENAKGELYVLTKADGKIYKITNAKKLK